MASHPNVVPLTPPPGVYSNIIADNESSHNGYQVPGAGAGAGIFAPFPGNKAYSNVIVNNLLKDNGLPGVAIHNHEAPPGTPAVDLNNNVIIGNHISGNAADTIDEATPGQPRINTYGSTPITDNII